MGVIVLLTIIICVVSRKKIASMYAILFSLLPFHEFIKQTLVHFSGSASLFPIWREIIIVIIICKVLSQDKRNNLNRITLMMICLLFLVYTFFMFKGIAVDSESSVSVYRLEIMCLLLFISTGSVILKIKDVILVLRCVCFSLLIVCISGIIERFFLYYPIHLFMGHISVGGRFVTSSFEIMGIPRMCGIMSGPNQFGVTLGMWIPLIFASYQRIKGFHTNAIVILLGFMLICLLLSFSRAGWFLCFAPFLYLILKSNKNSITYLLYAMVVVIVGLFVAAMLVPEAMELITDSLSGRESSASTRRDFLELGFAYFLDDPIGHGLGSGRAIGKTLTESAAIIMLYEIGFGGVLIFLLLFVSILDNSCNTQKSNYIHLAVRIIVASSIVVWIVSVNFDEAPFMFYLWSFMGLSINKSIQHLKLSNVGTIYSHLLLILTRKYVKKQQPIFS